MTRDEWNYRKERAKDQTPSTSAFIWAIPVFLTACWLCNNTEAGQEVAQQIAAVHVDMPIIGQEEHFVKQEYQANGNAQFAKYPHNDPSCGGELWCIAGWRL